jgi:hypothetical protein
MHTCAPAEACSGEPITSAGGLQLSSDVVKATAANFSWWGTSAQAALLGAAAWCACVRACVCVCVCQTLMHLSHNRHTHLAHNIASPLQVRRHIEL